MKKALTITLVAALALVGAGTAYANFCARDAVPASTILLPFARQSWDFDNNKTMPGWVTQLVITNVSEDAQIIHITVWTPESKAILDFDEVLSGYDMWQISSVDLLDNNPDGFRTGNDANGGPDKVNIDIPNHLRGGPSAPEYLERVPWAWGPDGPTSFEPNRSILSDPESTYSNLPSTDCYLNYPVFPWPLMYDIWSSLELAMANRQHVGCYSTVGNSDMYLPLRTLPTGFIDSTTGDGTWTTDMPTDELWYYMTVDVVKSCSLDFPNDANYFTERYKYANVLLGDLFYLNDKEGFKFSDVNKAVHIEGKSSQTSVDFYGEIANPGSQTDLEPLGTAFAAHFRNGDEGGAITSNLIVWKNLLELEADGDIDDCGSYLYYSWDMNEHSLSREVLDCPVSPCEDPDDYDPNEFPLETQLVPITTANFDLPDVSGWLLFVFQPSYDGTPPGSYAGDDGTWMDPTIPEDGKYATNMQVFALVQYIWGSYSGMLETAEMANAHCNPTEVLPQLNMRMWD